MSPPALAMGLVLMLMTAGMVAGKRAAERRKAEARIIPEMMPVWPRVGSHLRQHGWIFSRQPVDEKDTGEAPMYFVWFHEETGTWSVVFDDIFGWYPARGQASYGTMEELLEYVRALATAKTPFILIGVDWCSRTETPATTRDLTAGELQIIADDLWTHCQLKAYPIPDGW